VVDEATGKTIHVNQLFNLLLPTLYDRPFTKEIDQVFAAFEQLKNAVDASVVFSPTSVFTTKGHQDEPYKATAMHSLREKVNMTKEDAAEFTRLMTLKPKTLQKKSNRPRPASSR
jgi:hypothetical protein